MSWASSTTRIGQLCSISSSKRIHAREYEDTGVPFYRGKEIIEKHHGALSVSVEKFISEERFREIERKHGAPQSGDLLLTSVGTLGVPYVVKAGERFYFNDGNLTWFRDFEGLDVRFLYFWLLSPAGKEQLKRFTIGSSQPAFTIAGLNDMEIDVPPLSTQQRIAAILSAYDDLIETNTRRIAILEEMARRLYEEWFVHFRFPGHEAAEFDERSGQRLPRGWGVVGLYDVADVTYGHPFKSKLFNTDGEGLGVIRIRDVMADRASAFTTEEGKPQHRVDDGDILIGMDGSFYLGRWAGGEAWLNQRVARLRPKAPMSRHLLFQTIADPIKRLEGTIVGTTVAHLSAKDLKEMQVILPDEHGLRLAASHLEPTFDQILILKRKNANLRAQRDLLLPKLVSGEIDVSGAEKALEATE